MANNPNAPPVLALPPWFGPRAVLKEVERLVVDENNHAARGWTWQQIKDSLMQAHQLELEQEQGQLPQGFDAELRRVLSELRQGDHLVMGVNQQHYKLHTAVPHHLPSWFGKHAVLQRIDELDDDNNSNNDVGHGSTWAEIRNSLMETHQQQQLLLPPNFDKMLRKMLSLLRKRGHLAGGAGGRQHYTRWQAPALADPDPIPMEEFQLGYYLGYTMGGSDGFRIGNADGIITTMEALGPNGSGSEGEE